MSGSGEGSSGNKSSVDISGPWDSFNPGDMGALDSSWDLLVNDVGWSWDTMKDVPPFKDGPKTDSAEVGVAETEPVEDEATAVAAEEAVPEGSVRPVKVSDETLKILGKLNPKKAAEVKVKAEPQREETNVVVDFLKVLEKKGRGTGDKPDFAVESKGGDRLGGDGSEKQGSNSGDPQRPYWESGGSYDASEQQPGGNEAESKSGEGEAKKSRAEKELAKVQAALTELDRKLEEAKSGRQGAYNEVLQCREKLDAANKEYDELSKTVERAKADMASTKRSVIGGFIDALKMARESLRNNHKGVQDLLNGISRNVGAHEVAMNAYDKNKPKLDLKKRDAKAAEDELYGKEEKVSECDDWIEAIKKRQEELKRTETSLQSRVDRERQKSARVSEKESLRQEYGTTNVKEIRQKLEAEKPKIEWQRDAQIRALMRKAQPTEESIKLGAKPLSRAKVIAKLSEIDKNYRASLEEVDSRLKKFGVARRDERAKGDDSTENILKILGAAFQGSAEEPAEVETQVEAA